MKHCRIMSPKHRKRKRTEALDNMESDPEISFDFHTDTKRSKTTESKVKSDSQETGLEVDETPRKSPNGFTLPVPLPNGLILQDTKGYTWILGKSVGLGGFGEIYSAAKFGSNVEEYVIKVEPHSNGPLFVEIHFYIKSAKPEDIESFILQKKQKKDPKSFIGIPEFVASGSFFFRNTKYRFLVLPRLGIDIQTLHDQCGGFFPSKTAFTLALQTIQNLEYVHAHGYVHKDVKGSNLLLGKEDPNRVYLVDFGLASRYIHSGLHKPYVHDERWAHEGTLEYTSRDAHIGCPSRRGDVEVLLYNIIEWLGGHLPWDKPEFVKPSIIKEEKFKAFADINQFLKDCFKGKDFPSVLKTLMQMINRMNFEEQPDYRGLEQLFRHEINKSGGDAMVLSFPKGLGKETKRNNSEQENVKPNKSKTPPPVDRRCSEVFDKRCISPAKYLVLKEEQLRLQMEESLKNPTPEMLRLLQKRSTVRVIAKPKRRSRKARSVDPPPSPFTPAMEAIIELRKNRNSVESEDVTKGVKRLFVEEEYSQVDEDISFFTGTPMAKRFKADPERAKTKSPKKKAIPAGISPLVGSLQPCLVRLEREPLSIKGQVKEAMHKGLGNITGVLVKVSKSLFTFQK